MQDAVFRKVRGILNKLTPEKFDKLANSIIGIDLTSDVILKGVILLIINKAIDEPKFCFLYALLCKRLVEQAPNYDPPGQCCTFLRLLLSKCKDEFDNRSSITRALQSSVAPLSSGDEERLHVAKQKMLGNVRFISELGKQDLVSVSVLHACVQELLPRTRRHVASADLCADLECLCQLMSTCGRRLDTPEARPLMDQYFDRMHKLATAPATTGGATSSRQQQQQQLPARIRFLLRNTIELRANRWEVRANSAQEAPRPVTAIRQEARSCGVVLPIDGERGGFGAGLAGSLAPAAGLWRGADLAGSRHAGMDEVFGGVGPVGALGMLGTGPGVIDLNRSRYSGGVSGPGRYMGSSSLGAVNRSYNNGSMANKPVRQHYQQQHQHQQQPAALASLVGQSHHVDLAPRFMRLNGHADKLSLRPGATAVAAKSPAAPPGAIGQPQSKVAANGASGARTGTGAPTAADQDHQLRAKHKQQQQQQPLTRQQLRAAVLSWAEQLVWPPDQPPPAAAPATPQEQQEDMKEQQQQGVKEHQQQGVKEQQQQGVKEQQQQQEHCWSVEPACQAWLTELKVPAKHSSYLLQELLVAATDAHKVDRLMTVLASLCRSNSQALSSAALSDALRRLVTSPQQQQHQKQEEEQKEEEREELVSRPPVIAVAECVAGAVSAGVLTLAQVATDVVTVADHPLFFNVLQQLAASLLPDKLTSLVNDSKVSLMCQLPASDRTDEQLAAVLHQRQLQFLAPLLQLRQQLRRQLLEDSSAAALYQWIRAHVPPHHYTTTQFVQPLFCSVIEFVIEQAEKSALSEQNGQSEQTETGGTTCVPATADVQHREHQLLSGYRQLLQKFVHEQQQLQLAAVYALQLLAGARQYQRGLLLRWFVLLYDLEIVDEEAFLLWREDVNDQYPDKGKALFQVNQWLTWLELAESDDDNAGDN